MNRRNQFTLIGAAVVIIIALAQFGMTRKDAHQKFNLETDWTPEVPEFIQNKIKAKYAESPPNQKAMLQIAQALWMTLDPNQDFEKTDSRINRAIDCTFFRNISDEDSRELEAEVFFTDELTRRYLEWNKQFAGQMIQGRDYDETTCD